MHFKGNFTYIFQCVIIQIGTVEGKVDGWNIIKTY